MENSRIQDAASTAVNVTVGRRSREYLTEREVDAKALHRKRSRAVTPMSQLASECPRRRHLSANYRFRPVALLQPKSP